MQGGRKKYVVTIVRCIRTENFPLSEIGTWEEVPGPNKMEYSANTGYTEDPIPYVTGPHIVRGRIQYCTRQDPVLYAAVPNTVRGSTKYCTRQEQYCTRQDPVLYPAGPNTVRGRSVRCGVVVR